MQHHPQNKQLSKSSKWFDFAIILFLSPCTPVRRHVPQCPSQQRSRPVWLSSGRGPGCSRRTVQKKSSSLVHNCRFPEAQPQTKPEQWHGEPRTKGDCASSINIAESFHWNLKGVKMQQNHLFLFSFFQCCELFFCLFQQHPAQKNSFRSAADVRERHQL